MSIKRTESLLRVGLVLLLAGALYGQQARRASSSVRPPDSRRIRTAVTKLLGMQVSVPGRSFGGLTFAQAAVKVDALGLGYIETYSTQKVSAEIPKNLDDRLSPEELAAVKKRLSSLRLRIAAYRIATIPPQVNDQRKLFAFAQNLRIETIVSDPDPASLPALDHMANEFGVNVALDTGNPKSPAAYRTPKSILNIIQHFSPRIGVSADTRSWTRHGVKPADALSLLRGRLLVLQLHPRTSSMSAQVTQMLLEMTHELPPPIEHPDACSNCSRPVSRPKPVSIVVAGADANNSRDKLEHLIANFEQAVRPAMGYRVEQIARILPITSPDRVPAADREKIEAALPHQPLAKPKRHRKLLVIDLCPDGGYYHTTIAYANLALELMAKYTGAYEPVFSNDLDNLKYPKIKQYDAVFLNSTVGEVFADPAVLNGLIRFVREGGGLAGLHGASYASMDVPAFGEMLGAQDGPHHVETATIKIDDPNSPLTKAFHGKDFVYTDEFYHFLPTGPYSRKKLHILLSIDAQKTNLSRWHVRPDHDYGLSWIRTYGKGRVFNCALGHTPTLFETPALAKLILGGIQYVLGDLPADATPSADLPTRAQR